jgi:hypothetical protein
LVERRVGEVLVEEGVVEEWLLLRVEVRVGGLLLGEVRCLLAEWRLEGLLLNERLLLGLRERIGNRKRLLLRIWVLELLLQ